MSRWQGLMRTWRTQRDEMRQSVDLQGVDFATALSVIEADRQMWEGTKRTICTEEELEGRYRIRGELGRGSFGTVYRAIRVEDAEELAVKVIEHGDSALERASAIDECALWMAVSSPYHPSILPLLEVIEVIGSESLHLITLKMEWGTLAEALQDVEVETCEQSTRMMMIQLVSAVEHLHIVHSIAHRDIKPENVLCERQDPAMPGCLKLCDFGCCRRFESLTEPTFDDAMGTINYLSPELAMAFLSSEKMIYAGPPADCWALGVVCYEIMHGACPFAGRKLDDRESKLMRIASPLDKGAVELPDESFGHISDAGRQFLTRLLTRPAAGRATVQEALQLPWLQPVDDKALRDAMCEAAPKDVEARRLGAKKTLRSAMWRVVLVNRLMRAAPPASPARQERQPSLERQPSAASFASSFKRRSLSRQPSAASFATSFKRRSVSRQSSKSSVLGSLSFKAKGSSFRNAASFQRRGATSPPKGGLVLAGDGSQAADGPSVGVVACVPPCTTMVTPVPAPMPARPSPCSCPRAPSTPMRGPHAQVDVVNVDPIVYHASPGKTSPAGRQWGGGESPTATAAAAPPLAKPAGKSVLLLVAADEPSSQADLEA